MPNASPQTRRQRLCPWCPRSFTKGEHLARHVRTHTKEKPFICTECKKSSSRQCHQSRLAALSVMLMSSSDSLLRHIRSHKSGDSMSPRGANASSSDTMLSIRDHCASISFYMQHLVSHTAIEDCRRPHRQRFPRPRRCHDLRHEFCRLAARGGLGCLRLRRIALGASRYSCWDKKMEIARDCSC
ncbi:C2H2-type zinc finger protein [Aspergillus undulatus]|uniref:C2H2-type zinc finger protein n=1 Tax=Aspergillus undulatus TaxID=1810928 RepID=UPI003CCDEA3A